MRQLRVPLIVLMTTAILAGCSTTPHTALQLRTGFLAFRDFSKFTQTPGSQPGEVVLTSSEIKPPLAWNELIASWNTTPGAYLKVEARAIYPNHTTKYYTMSIWSDDPSKHPRTSVSHQRDDDGTVKQDTLIVAHPGGLVQLRLTLGSNDPGKTPKLKFVGLSFCDSRVQIAPAAPNRAAWGKTLAIPERRQGDYEGGGGWCSPTSLSMVLAYWSDQLGRPELNNTVPDVAHSIHDSDYDGTGNWPFNTAYAGQFPGMHAYVTRLNDMTELEDWIAAGVAPIISVSSYLTNDRHSGPDSGHLIVCAGFTENGDMVANDPGVHRVDQPRRVYPRERVINAWKKSKNAVYLVYPESVKPPPNRSGNWDAD